MKQLATIGTVVLVLLAAAFYFNAQQAPQQVVQTTTTTVVEPTEQTPPAADLPVIHAAANGTLTVASSISNGYLTHGGTHDVYAAIDVSAIAHKSAERPPLNIAMVIDRSGSMAGDKIEHAKAAARRLVHVLGPQDRVAIVSYGSDVSVDFYSQPVNDSTRMSLLRAINNIEVGGGTNLSGGFQRGFSEVSKWKDGEAISRVVLMSDGLANIGITHTPKIVSLATNALNAKVTVSTIGMGLDYNEDLMTQMANEGAGKYYFVDRSETIVSMLDQELQGLASTVARNTAVVVKLGPGVTMSEVYGFPSTNAADAVYVALGEFASEEKKNILMKLSVDGAMLGLRPIIQTSISYDDLVKEGRAHDTVACTAAVTTDASLLGTMVNVDVIGRVQQIEVAQSIANAMTLYESGDAAAATQALEDTRTTMRARRDTHEFKNSARYDAADRELQSLGRQIQAGPAPSSEGGRRMIKAKKAWSNDVQRSVDLF